MRRPPYLPANSEPFSTINTTPMIDVMLVLIIMMILSLPPLTHEVPIDLPVGGASNGPPPPVHRLSITENGGYLWDNVPMAGAELPGRLAAFKTDPAGPVLHVETSPAARYGRFDETMALVKTTRITKIGFVGNPARF